MSSLDEQTADERTADERTADEQTAAELLRLVAAAAPVVRAPHGLAAVVLDTRRRRGRRRLAAGGGAVVLAAALVAATRTGSGDYLRYYQPSGAMAPTVAPGQSVVVRKGVVPLLGDVVLLTVRGKGQPYESLGRVVGLPGDTVSCADDGHGRCAAVTVSGHTLHESWLTTATPPFAAVTVGPGEVFLLGDARDQANDSRFIGPQPLSAVEGAAVARVQPDHTLARLPGTPDRPLPGQGDTVDPGGTVPASRSDP